MKTRTLFRKWAVVCAALGLGCTASSNLDQTETVQTISAALTGPIQNDFEDGTTQNWFPFGSPTIANSTEQAFSGTHSLKTTNRTASFMGPAINVQGQLTKGATSQVTVSARLVAGQPMSTILATMARTPTGGSTQFDTVL